MSAIIVVVFCEIFDHPVSRQFSSPSVCVSTVCPQVVRSPGPPVSAADSAERGAEDPSGPSLRGAHLQSHLHRRHGQARGSLQPRRPQGVRRQVPLHLPGQLLLFSPLSSAQLLAD